MTASTRRGQSGDPATPGVGAATPADLAVLLGAPPPTAEQATVIGAPLRSGLVVAGAGSGKTETMASRVVYLVATGQVRPGEVLGLTFTRKAAAELAERIADRLDRLFRMYPVLAAEIGDGDRTATVSTYDGFAHRVVVDHGLRLGFEPTTRLLRPAEAWQLADRVVRTWDGELSDYQPAVSTAVEVVRSLHDQLAAHGRDVAALDRFLAETVAGARALPDTVRGRSWASEEVRDFVGRQQARRELLSLVTRYRSRLGEVRAVDFAGIAEAAAQLAEQVPEVAAASRGDYRLVLLDEFQDTSPAQLRLVTGAFAGIAVTAVGDPHQSIYGWRGAGADTLGAFGRSLSGDGTRGDGTHGSSGFATLSTSFRNAGPVLDAANVIAAPLAATTSVRVPTLLPLPDRTGGRVAVTMYRTAAEEATALAQTADAELGPQRSVAVLVRSRRQVEPLLAAMRSADVPVEVVGLGGLLGVPVVVELLSVLRVVADPDRGDALMRLLTGARWRLGPRDLDGLADLARQLRRLGGEGRSPIGATGPAQDGLAQDGLAVDEPDAGIVDALDLLVERPQAGRFSAAGRQRLVRLARELRELRTRVDQPLGEMVADVVAVTGLGTELAAGGSRAAGSATDLAAFTEEADRYAQTGGRDGAAGVAGFLAYLDVAEQRERGLDRGGNPTDDDPDPESEPETVEVARGRVQLLTVHAAKGLEWDVVLVPGLVDGVFPAAAHNGKGWISDLGQLPHPLRADRASLPALRDRAVADTAELRTELARHGTAMRRNRLAEERRLAYVAVTRAREVLVASGHYWGGTKGARVVGPFLTELHDLALRRVGGTPDAWQVDPWADDPGEPPDADAAATALWPAPVAGDAHAAGVEAGAALVSAELAAGVVPAGDADDEPAGDADDEPAGGDGGEAAGWARDVDLLLGRTDQPAAPVTAPVTAAASPADGRPPVPAAVGATVLVDVPLPGVLSVSGLVALARDPDGFALDVRRPVPREPRTATRLGTRFHAWLEQRWNGARLIDVDDLPGSADDATDAVMLDDAALRALQGAFAASPWADRVPTDVEYPFAMPMGAVVLRGRIDAVFSDEGTGTVEVVDWKTGPPPRDSARLAGVAVQLAAYRLAWHRATGVPLEHISGAFHHVGEGVTVRPADLLDEAGLVALVSRLPTGGPA